MFFTDGNGSGGAGTGTGAAAAQGANTAGNADGQANSNGSSGKADTSEFVSKSELTALTKKLDGVLADNAKYRAKIKALASDDDSDDTSGGKPDKQAQKLANLLQAARSDRFTAQVTTAAVKLGAEHPELVVRALNLDEVADDLGNVADVDKVVGDLKAKYPNLFSKTQQGFGNVNGGDSGGNNRKRTSADVNAEIRAFRRGRELPAR